MRGGIIELIGDGFRTTSPFSVYIGGVVTELAFNAFDTSIKLVVPPLSEYGKTVEVYVVMDGTTAYHKQQCILAQF